MNTTTAFLGLGCLPLLVAFATTSAQAAPSSVQAAQSPARAFPFDVVARDASSETIDLEVRAADVRELGAHAHVKLIAVPMPDGTSVDLDLERIDVEAMRFAFQVDDRARPDLVDELDLTLWSGRVVGAEDSDVSLALSRHGSRGWIVHRGELVHLVAGPGPASKGGWANPRARIVTESALARSGRSLGAFCRSDALEQAQREPQVAQGKTTASSALSTTLFECKVAIETDFQLFQVFGGNLSAETTYVTTLLGWVSYRYQQQIDTLLSYPYVKLYTTSNDPWQSQEQGGSSVDLLFEFQNAWQFNLPAGAHLAAFVSGAGLGGGVAWLPGLCGEPYNFSVSGNIDGDVTFPITQNPSNWDFMVLAHELGHNFGAPHAHDYCPPLDQCAPSGYFGQCQNQQVCTNQGTLMSYCHLCGGGLANITTFFHAQSAFDMRTHVESSGCLPVYTPDPVVYCQAKTSSQGCVPAIAHDGHPTLGGPDDFVLSASQMHANKNGMFFYGAGAASTPFAGGTLCIAQPIVRTTVQQTGGGAQSCSGSLTYAWTHAAMATAGVGTTIYGQFWFRDAQSQGVGLSNAIAFTIVN